MTDTEKAALERRIYDRCLVRVGQLEAEKAALERRIDELCQENERLRADQAHWELGNCPSCPNVVSLQEALEQNAKLRELGRGLLTGYECGYGELCEGCSWDGLGDPKTFPCRPRVMARELGIEVDA